MANDANIKDRPDSAQADAERYRVAAEAALGQLDWCISYLHRIRKAPIAEAVARNQSEIRKRLS